MRFEFPVAEQRQGNVRILTVCTGNICRSPLAEVLLRQGLSGLPVNIASAGTHALVGQPMTEQNQRIAVELGVLEADPHQAVQITRDMIRDADLVLALSREHRRYIVDLLPRASRNTYTLREFARLANAYIQDDGQLTSDSHADALRDLIENVAQTRGSLPLQEDLVMADVIDPFGQSDEVYQRSASQLVPAVQAIVQALRTAVRGSRA